MGENLDMNICSQQLPLAKTNCSKEKKRRGERRCTMGYGLDSITSRTRSKMKIDFTEGENRPLNPLHASKLSLEVGMHVQKHLLIEPKWKNYNLPSHQHIIPEAIDEIKVRHQMNLFCNCAIQHLFNFALYML